MIQENTLGSAALTALETYRDENHLTPAMADDVLRNTLKSDEWKCPIWDANIDRMRENTIQEIKALGPGGVEEVYSLVLGYGNLCRRKKSRRLRFCLWIAMKVLR